MSAAGRSSLVLWALTFGAAVAAAGCGARGSAAPAPHAGTGVDRAGRAGGLGARTAPAPFVGDYAVTWVPGTGSLEVEARLTSAAGGLFRVERGADRYTRGVVVSPDVEPPTWTPAARRGALFEAPACAAGPCRIRYRFALRAAARALDDLDVANEDELIVEAPPSTWLLVPADADRDLRLRFRVSCPDRWSFVTGVFPSREAKDAWDITLDDLRTAPYSAFGPFRLRSIPVKGATLQLAIGASVTAVGDDALVQWVEASAAAVTTYFGRFPIPTALVLVVLVPGRWVGGGRTLAGGGGTVFMRAGVNASLAAYKQDWVLTHEMIHLAFPSVAREHDWAEEGIATYAEPFARVRAGTLTEEEAWRGLAQGLPNGLPAAGDRGLDHTPTWGRTYWGGALFWFLADIELRKRTQNRLGLEHALRGVLAAGGSNAVRWSLADVLSACDDATGQVVMRELHAAMGSAPHPVDLGALMRSLGVEIVGDRAKFDENAPLAHVRRAITYGEDKRAENAESAK